MAARALLGRLLSPFKPAPPNGRHLQLSLDAATLYTLITSTARRKVGIPPPDPNQSAIAALLDLPHLPHPEHQAATVKSHLHARTKRVLRATHDAIISPQSLEDAVALSLRFCPMVRPSSVSSAGRGVFVSGTAKPGDVVALYPGVSYLPSQLRREALIPGDYAIARYDGVTIDGAADVTLDLSEALAHADISERELVHPFANGHLINHPPPGGSPNALQFMVDIDVGSLPPGLRALVPVDGSSHNVSHLERLENLAVRQRVPGVELYVGPVPEERIRRTIAIIALREITDEELFINYRFNPEIDAPQWYADCDPESSERRWKGRGILL